MNGDDKVDAKDATLVLVAYSKLSTGGENAFSEAKAASADVNGDGKTDAKDASLILAYYSLVSTSKGDVPTLREYVASLQKK